MKFIAILATVKIASVPVEAETLEHAHKQIGEMVQLAPAEIIEKLAGHGMGGTLALIDLDTGDVHWNPVFENKADLMDFVVKTATSFRNKVEESAEEEGTDKNFDPFNPETWQE